MPNLLLLYSHCFGVWSVGIVSIIPMFLIYYQNICRYEFGGGTIIGMVSWFWCFCVYDKQSSILPLPLFIVVHHRWWLEMDKKTKQVLLHCENNDSLFRMNGELRRSLICRIRLRSSLFYGRDLSIMFAQPPSLMLCCSFKNRLTFLWL